MSKTSQRRVALFRQGRNDGSFGLPFRWNRHPHLKDYRRGYKVGLKTYAQRLGLNEHEVKV